MTIITKYKTGDTSLSSNTTLTNDPELTATVQVSTHYSFKACLLFSSASTGTTPGVRIGLTFPTGTVADFHIIGSTAAGVPGKYGLYTSAYVGAMQNMEASAAGKAHWLTGHINVGAGPGTTFAISWAQMNSSGTALKLLEGSWMKLVKLA